MTDSAEFNQLKKYFVRLLFWKKKKINICEIPEPKIHIFDDVKRIDDYYD